MFSDEATISHFHIICSDIMTTQWANRARQTLSLIKQSMMTVKMVPTPLRDSVPYVFHPSLLRLSTFSSPPQGLPGLIEVSIQKIIVLNPADRKLPFYPSINRIIAGILSLPSPSHTCSHQHFMPRPPLDPVHNTILRWETQQGP